MNARRSLPVAILALAALTSLLDPARADQADDQFAVAAGHYDREQWSLAVEEFRTFLEKHPQHPQEGNATFFLGMAHVRLQEYDAARTQFRKCSERKPEGRKAIEAAFRVGEMGYFLDDRETARRDLATFREQHPDDSLNAYALPYLADLALKAKLCVEAESLYREALKAYSTGPKQDHCRFGLAQALEGQGKNEEPALLYTALASKAGPLAEQALYFLGKRQYADGRHAEAIASFDELEKKHPDSRYRPSARLGKGCALFRDRKHDDAQAIFESLADDKQLGVEARLWLGAIHKARRNWETAAATMLEAARREPDHPRCPELLFHVADCQRMAGQHAEATKMYDEVLERWPKHALTADCLLGKLRAAAAAGDHERIAALAERIGKDFAGRPAHDEAQRRLARSLIERGNAQAAVAILEPLGAGSPASAHRWESRQLLAEAYFQLEQNDKAEAAIEPLLTETVPTEVRTEAQYTLGRLLVAARRWDKAIAALEAFVAAQSAGERAARCRAELLIAYAKTGQVEKALAGHVDLTAQHGEQIEVVSLATFRLADALFAEKRYSEAGSLYRLLATDPRHQPLAAEGWSGLGWSQYQTALLQLATESFARLLADHPRHALAADGALARAQILEQLQKKEEALAAYELVIERYGTGQRLATALFGAAQLHGQLGHHGKAAELYQRLLDEFPDFAQKDAALYQLAWACHDSQQAAEAEKAFRRLHAEHRGSRFWGDATFRTAQAAFVAGRCEEAGRLADELLASRPQADVLAHTLLLQGRLAVNDEKWAAVAPPLERLLKEFPESPLREAAEYYLAEAEYQQGRHEQAARQFAALAPRLAGQTDKWVAMVPLRHAQSLAHLQRWAEARQIAEGIAAAHGDFEAQYEVDYVLGRCLAGQAMFREAREAYERVIRSANGGRTETAAMAQWMIGETYFHQKDYRTALKEYLRVEILYTYPKWQAAALLQAGKCCEQLGHWSLAAKYFERVVSQYGNTEFKAEAEKRLSTAQRKRTQTR
jgi:TolA-binding protein